MLRAGALIIIISAGTAVYANSLDGAFVFDDPPSIVENLHIRSLWPLSESMTAPLGSGASARPLVCLSLAVNYALGGLDVWGYHAFNIAIHLFTAMTLFGACRLACSKLTTPANAEFISFASALLWVVHPLNSDALNHVIYRHEAMMALFYSLTAYAAMRGLLSEKPLRWYVVSVVACACGMASKENMVSAPLFVLLVDRTLFSGSFKSALKQRWGLYLALVGTGAILAASILSGYRGSVVGFGLEKLHWPEYWLTSCGVLWTYFQLALWPSVLVIDYYDWPIASSIGQVWPSVCATALLIVFVIWATLSKRWIGLLGMLLFFVLSPTSLIPNEGEVLAEHRMYLPLFGVIVAVVVAVVHATKRIVRDGLACNVILGAVVLALVLPLGLRTVRRNMDYRSAITLWEATIEARPNSARAYNNLASELISARDLKRARHYATRTLEIMEEFAEAHVNIGIIDLVEGKMESGLAHFRKAIEIKPQLEAAHTNLANALLTIGDHEQGAKHSRIAYQINPQSLAAMNNLGRLHMRAEDFDGAMAYFQRILSISPVPEVLVNQAHCWFAKGQSDKAIALCQQALQIDPHLSAAHYELGLILEQHGQHEHALLSFRSAVRDDPFHVEATRALANQLIRHEQFTEAATVLASWKELQPRNPEVFTKLGSVLRSLQRPQEAIEQFSVAVELSPDDFRYCNNLGLTYMEVEDYSKARKYLTKAMVLSPLSASVHNNLGMYFMQTGDFEQARRHFSRAIVLQPGFEQAIHNLEALDDDTEDQLTLDG